MDCKEFSNLLDAYGEGALPDEEAARLQAHAAGCAQCAHLLAVRGDCRALAGDVEVPDAFPAAWRQAIREEERMEQGARRKKSWQTWLAAAAAVVFLVGGTLLTRNPAGAPAPVPSAYESKAAAGAAANSRAMPNVLSEASTETADLMLAADTGTATVETNEKIIRSARFTLKTLAFDEDLGRLKALAATLGGREEYLSLSGDQAAGETRSASLTLRIPAARLDEFLGGAETIGRVTAMNQESEDVSDSYYDVQTRLATQQQKMTRLQALMATAENVSDLIEIESAVADTQYLIDSYTSQLQSYDSRVSYSTVRVTIREILPEENDEAGLGERIAAGLRASLAAGLRFLEDAAIFLVSALPWLLALGVLVFALRLIFKKKK